MRELRFEKVLKTAPRDTEALFGLGLIAKLEGRFYRSRNAVQASSRVQAQNGQCPGGTRDREKDDARGQRLAASRKGIAGRRGQCPRGSGSALSIGKYHDDLGEFDEAFRSYEAANGLLKRSRSTMTARAAMPSSTKCCHAYTKDVVAAVGEGASPSVQTRVHRGYAPFGHFFDRAHTRFASLCLRCRRDGVLERVDADARI